MHFLCTNHKNCFPKDFSLGCWITEASKCDLTTRNPDFPDPPEHHCVFFCIFFEHLFFPLFLNIFWILLGPPPPFLPDIFSKMCKKDSFWWDWTEIYPMPSEYFQKCFKKIQKVSKRFIFFEIVLNFFWNFWLHLAPSGSIRPHLAPSGSIWSNWPWLESNRRSQLSKLAPYALRQRSIRLGRFNAIGLMSLALHSALACLFFCSSVLLFFCSSVLLFFCSSVLLFFGAPNLAVNKTQKY